MQTKRTYLSPKPVPSLLLLIYTPTARNTFTCISFITTTEAYGHKYIKPTCKKLHIWRTNIFQNSITKFHKIQSLQLYSDFHSKRLFLYIYLTCRQEHCQNVLTVSNNNFGVETWHPSTPD